MSATSARHVALRGYGLVAVSYLIMGAIGALVDSTTAPESALLVVRFATAGVVLGAVFARRRPLAGVRRPGIAPRLLLMGLVDAGTLLLFFVALRDTNVSIGMFLEFAAPVYVALAAPHLLHARTEPLVYAALAVALAGLATILLPSLLGQGVRVSTLGLVAGTVSGLGYATFQLVVKDLTDRGVGAVTIVISEMTVDALVLLPLALWQTVGARPLDERPRPAHRHRARPGLHGARLHPLDRGREPHPGAALRHPRLFRAGERPALRRSSCSVSGRRRRRSPAARLSSWPVCSSCCSASAARPSTRRRREPPPPSAAARAGRPRRRRPAAATGGAAAPPVRPGLERAAAMSSAVAGRAPRRLWPARGGVPRKA